MSTTQLGLLPAPRRIDLHGGTFVLSSAADVTRRLDPALDAEGYVLDVREDGIELRGGDAAGLFYGEQTLLQLLPVELLPAARRSLGTTLAARPVEIPTLRIEDSPAYPWRGFLLDVSRHFFSVEFLKRVLDQLAAHKLNVLHLHLTDDQGWRFPVPRYPLLTEVGGRRSETIVGFDHERDEYERDGIPHEGAYTRAQLEELVAYAGSRFVRILPEIDLPGHSAAAVTAYPELGSGEPAEVRTRWGISTRILNVEDGTLDFAAAVLDEVVDVFPGEFVHAGGDEVPKKEWRESPSAQRRIAELGLADELALQGWFTEMVAEHLRSHGRRLIAWDEVAETGIGTDTVIMAWRSTEHGLRALEDGYDVVMSPSEYLYLDHRQSADADEPVTFPAAPVTLERVFSFEPVPPEAADRLDAASGRVLGGQANLWTEYVPDEKHAEYMAFPRLSAFAEAIWRAPREDGGERDFAEFRARLERHAERLRAEGIGFRPLDSDQPTG